MACVRPLAPVAVLLLVVGCGRPPSVGAGGATAKTPRPYLTWAIRNEVLSIDPVRANEENTASVLAQVAEPLVGIDPEGRVVPCLADRWTVAPDKVTFHLAETTFSDGSPLTSKDVKSTFERARDPKLMGKEIDSFLGKVRSVEAPDSSTVVVYLTEPTRAIVPMLASPQLAILPARLRNTPIDKPSDLVGTGAYRMTEHRPDERIVLEPNPHWRGGKLSLSRIEVIPIKDASALLNRFRAQDVDLMQVASNNVGDVMESKDLKTRATALPSTKVIYLFFQPEAFPPFKDARVRRAIAMALDRRRLAEDMVRGEAVPASRLLPPALAPDKPMLPTYDLATARRLLAEAGYPDGKGMPPIPFVFHDANRLNPIVDFVPSSLRSLGLKVRPQPALDFLERAGRHQIPLGLSGWGALFPDPQSVLGTLLLSNSPSNYAGYASPAFDAAERKAERSGRIEDFEAAERIVAADMPIVPLYVQPKVWLTSPRVSGVVLSTYGAPDFSKATLK